MYILVSELPDSIFDLFKQIDEPDVNKNIWKMFLNGFITYLKNYVLTGVENYYIDDCILNEEIRRIFCNFLENRVDVEKQWWKRVMNTEERRAQFYEMVFERILEKEKKKDSKLTEKELLDIEIQSRKEFVLPYNQSILEDRIFQAIQRFICFNENELMDSIEVYLDRWDKNQYQFFSFTHKGRIFEVCTTKASDEVLEVVENREQGLTRLPINFCSLKDKNKIHNCLIIKNGEYLDEFDVDISLVDLRKINVKKIKNINYILLFLKQYGEKMENDYLYRRNFEILKHNLAVPSQNFRKNYQLLRKLRKNKSMEFPLNLFENIIEEFLRTKVVENKIRLSAYYLEDILGQYQDIVGLTLHSQAYLAISSQFKELLNKERENLCLESECSKIIRNQFDDDLWNFLNKIICEYEHLLVVKPRTKVRENNYKRWENFEMDRLALVNVKTIGTYGILCDDEVYTNVHGVKIEKSKWCFYRSRSFQLSLGLIFPRIYPRIFSYKDRESAYKKLFGPHNFYVVRGKIDESLHLEAKNVLLDSEFMLNAFLTNEEFECQYRKLDIIFKHLQKIDLRSATVDDYYIDWKEELGV